MITSTPAVAPALLDKLLTALLDNTLGYREIATHLGLQLDKLFNILDSPEIQAKIERMQRLLDQRARLLSVANEAAAVGALGAVISEIRDSKAHRASLQQAREEAATKRDEPGIERAERGLADLETHFRKLAEASRCARALLTQSRTRSRPTPTARPAQEPAPRTPGPSTAPAPA